MRRAQDWAWSALVDAEPLLQARVGPWQYQSEGSTQLGGCRLGTTRYTTLPVPTHRTAPLYRTPVPHPWATPLTATLGSPKEILGVDNAHHGYWGRSGHAGAVSALRPPYAPALRPAPWRLHSRIPQYSSVFLSISQYFSGYLSISQDISVILRISQYFSVFLSY